MRLTTRSLLLSASVAIGLFAATATRTPYSPQHLRGREVIAPESQVHHNSNRALEDPNPDSRFCGTNWQKAHDACDAPCPSGLDKVCGPGQYCFGFVGCTPSALAKVPEPPESLGPILPPSDYTPSAIEVPEPVPSSAAYRCGSSWDDAATKCGIECQKDDDCIEVNGAAAGDFCYADVECVSDSDKAADLRGMMCVSNWENAQDECATANKCTSNDDCSGVTLCMWIDCQAGEEGNQVVDTTTPGTTTLPGCNAEVKGCPSGKYVARAPELNCEFYPCPEDTHTNTTEPEAEAFEDGEVESQGMHLTRSSISAKSDDPTNNYFCGLGFDQLYDCAVHCPGGTVEECPKGQICYFDTPCDARLIRDTPAPVSAPIALTNAVGDDSDISTIVVEAKEDSSAAGSDDEIDETNAAEDNGLSGNSNGAGATAGGYVDLNRPSSDPRDHYFCGRGYEDAVSKCLTNCPSGSLNDCPDGEICFFNTPCDARMMTMAPQPPSLTVSPKPSISAEMAMHRYSFCGAFWADARDNCDTKQHCEDDNDCPEFEYCWTETPCDFFATPPTKWSTTFESVEGIPTKSPTESTSGKDAKATKIFKDATTKAGKADPKAAKLIPGDRPTSKVPKFPKGSDSMSIESNFDINTSTPTKSLTSSNTYSPASTPSESTNVDTSTSYSPTQYPTNPQSLITFLPTVAPSEFTENPTASLPTFSPSEFTENPTTSNLPTRNFDVVWPTDTYLNTTLFAWGAQESLGLPTGEVSLPKSLDIRVIDASGGSKYSLIILSDGTAQSSGYIDSMDDYHGHLGLKETDVSVGSNEFQNICSSFDNGEVISSPPFTRVFAGVEDTDSPGSIHSFFIDDQGQAWATGSNANGELCLGDNENRLIPTRVTLDGNVISVAIGSKHTVLLLEDGTVYTCGSNEDGQLAIGEAPEAFKNTPTKVEDLKDVRMISAGMGSSLFLASTGLYVAGNNEFGQSCVDTNTGSLYKPTKLEGVNARDITSFEAIATSSFILFKDGSVAACGRNNFGQLGDGTYNDKVRAVVNPIPDGIPTRRLGVGPSSQSVFFVNDDGSIYATGLNDRGQLGVGDTENKSTPTLVEYSGDSLRNNQVSAAADHTLAR